MKATIWLFVITILAVLGVAFSSCVAPALFNQRQLRQESVVLDAKFSDRDEFNRLFAQTVDEWQRGGIEFSEASARILEASRRTFPQYVDLLKQLEGTNAERLTAEELVARNIRSRAPRATADNPPAYPDP